jgi:NAD(P)-dependent dehydrogenase (short-subunit alcohol dehydrogenase family)
MEGFAGKVAAITGAGSGIGQALALELGRSGAKLAISDVDTEGLAQTEEQLKAIGAPVKADRLDVTEREAFLLYADAVNEHFGKVNQIYNNAGIAFTGDIEAQAEQRHCGAGGPNTVDVTEPAVVSNARVGSWQRASSYPRVGWVMAGRSIKHAGEPGIVFSGDPSHNTVVARPPAAAG